MSTKIFNGYRVANADGTRPDPFTFLETLRVVLGATYRAAYVHTLVTQSCLILDRRAVEAAKRLAVGEPAAGQVAVVGDGLPPVFAVDALLDDAAAAVARTGRRDPENDFTAEVTLLRDPKDPDGPMFALLYTEQDAYTAAFADLPGVTPHGYWNNTDRPDELTDEQWDDRGDLWNRLVGGDAPATRGLSWQLLGQVGTLNPLNVRDDVAAAIPGVEVRANTLARTLVAPVHYVEGNVRLRERAVVLAEVAAMTAELLPVLPALSAGELYAHQDTAAVPNAALMRSLRRARQEVQADHLRG